MQKALRKISQDEPAVIAVDVVLIDCYAQFAIDALHCKESIRIKPDFGYFC